MSDPFWSVYFTLLSFFGGACVGSFVNVCVYRIPRGESIVRPRSRCLTCGQPIAWFDNVPLISFFLLRGRCRQCRGRISIRYPFVELLTAVLFLAFWNRYGMDARTVVGFVATTGLLIAAFVDWDFMIIPDRISLGGMPAGLIASALVSSLHGQEHYLGALLHSVAGLVTGVALLYAVAVVGRQIFKKDAMGLGDVKLLGAIGAFVGVSGVLFTIFVSSLLGSLVGVALILAGRHEWQGRIPYGPYLAAGALIWLLGGREWWLDHLRYWLGV